MENKELDSKIGRLLTNEAVIYLFIVPILLLLLIMGFMKFILALIFLSFIIFTITLLAGAIYSSRETNKPNTWS